VSGSGAVVFFVISSFRGQRRHATALVALLLYFVPASLVEAQSADPARASDLAIVIDGPPPPGAPAVISRDNAGRATMRAVRLEEPLHLDGHLDESVYESIPGAGDFIQTEPREGQPATEKTELWIFFDDRNIYVAVRCWDSQPDRIVANEMRRDNVNIFLNDNVTVAFDTYYDRRSGFFFQINALGGMRDGIITNEAPNFDWNTVWDARSSRFSQGWTTEMVIPFKSLRYREGPGQVWGVNVRRNQRWRNETTNLTRIPSSSMGGGAFRVSFAATLVGIEPPSRSVNLELKPYANSDVTTNRLAEPPTSNKLHGQFGFDTKYGLTRSLIADFTYNTDFAQVEADDQQVNLTRFNLLFPEKREFFLEGQGIFQFGGSETNLLGSTSSTPVLFFSRQIGLNNGQTVPIRAGGRLTGRAAKYTIGLVNIQTEDSLDARAVSTNFSVVRVKRDIFRKSAIGFISTGRFPTTAGNGSNQAAGIDAKLKFFQDLEVNSYYARTWTAGRAGDAKSYQLQLLYPGDRYGLVLERLEVGESFKPEIGFLLRSDFARNDAQVRFSPRPKSLKGIRKVIWQAELERFAGGDGRRETQNEIATFGLDLENGDTTSLVFTREYEFLRSPFRIAKGVVLPSGGYPFQQIQAIYRPGPQRKATGTLTITRGSFYSGDRNAFDYSGRLELHPQVSLEPRVSLNWVDLPQGNFTTRLLSARTTYMLSPRAFVGALIQYNSSLSTFTTNVRFRWEYQPGSDLFVVYSEGRNTEAFGPDTLANRGVAVKVTRLLRF
jgi:hypothetical protein